MSDILRQQIEDRLSRELDGNAFERCAVDLLRSIYPSLVPIRGGNDAGRDGAIADDEGPPTPLICTTREDVSANLRGSLKAHLDAGGPPRAVLATSRVLTPTRVRNLYKAAAAQDVTLIQIHDGAWFAMALYRDCGWRKNLLGLAGDAPPFASFPPTARDSCSHELIGRDRELKWLKTTPGDVLLIGQPGFGKTSLLAALVPTERALFAFDEDRTRLADGLRSQMPPIVLVDDAHAKPAQLLTLVQLRRQVDLPFRIVATCWPGREASVAETLGIGSKSQRLLRPLPREQMVEVIASLGLEHPREWVEMILNQSNGSPGLAATLVTCCLRDDPVRVWKGEAIERCFVSRGFLRDAGDRALLATIAVSGSVGVRPAAVAEVLGTNAMDVHKRLTDLSEAGLIRSRDDRVAVVPEALRWVLVRDELLNKPTPLAWRQIIIASGALASCAHVLFAAHQRGGQLSLDEMFQVATKADDGQVWYHFACLGQNASERLLAEQPDHILDAAQGLLEYAPDATTKALLQRAIKGDAGTRSRVLQRFDHWLGEHRQGTEELLRRRAMLANSARHLPPHAASETVLSDVCASVMRPAFASTAMAPGKGNAVVCERGLFWPEMLHGIEALWPEVLRFIQTSRVTNLKPILDVLRMWCFPQGYSGGAQLREDQKIAIRTAAVRMLGDLVGIAAGGHALQHWLAETARDAELPIVVKPDPLYEVLYGGRRRGERWDESQRRAKECLAAHLKAWIVRGPSGLLSELDAYDRVHGITGIKPQENACRVLAAELAREVESPVTWGAEFARAGRGWAEVLPFLKAATDSKEPGWDGFAAQCLATPAISVDAAMHILHLGKGIPPELEARALDVIEQTARYDHPLYAGFDCSKLSLPIRARLLESSSRDVRAAAVMSEWMRISAPPKEPELANPWRSAVVRFDHSEESTFAQILKGEHDLAEEWVETRLKASGIDWEFEWGWASAALAGLPLELKARLLKKFGEGTFDAHLVDTLIGDDTSLYGLWLADPEKRTVQACPLQTQRRYWWAERAQMALAAGCSVGEVAKYCLPYRRKCGSGSVSYWQEWVKWFEQLESSSEGPMRDVASLGITQAKKALSEAKAQAEEEDVYGWGGDRR